MATKPTCHPDRKHQAKGLCANCYNTNLRKTNPAYKAKCAEIIKKHVSVPANHRRKQSNLLRRRYGITMDQKDELLKEQLFKCKICRKEKKRLIVEHCHKTKRVRGLTCDACNTLIGYIETYYSLLPAVFAYISSKNFPATGLEPEEESKCR